MRGGVEHRQSLCPHVSLRRGSDNLFGIGIGTKEVVRVALVDECTLGCGRRRDMKIVCANSNRFVIVSRGTTSFPTVILLLQPPCCIHSPQTSSNCRVALCSFSTAGVGYTLTAATVVLFAELHWLPGQLSQAEDRAHRIGQRQSLHVQYLCADGTVDSSLWTKAENTLADVSGLMKMDRVKLAEEGCFSTTDTSSTIVMGANYGRGGPCSGDEGGLFYAAGGSSAGGGSRVKPAEEGSAGNGKIMAAVGANGAGPHSGCHDGDCLRRDSPNADQHLVDKAGCSSSARGGSAGASAVGSPVAAVLTGLKSDAVPAAPRVPVAKPVAKGRGGPAARGVPRMKGGLKAAPSGVVPRVLNAAPKAARAAAVPRVKAPPVPRIKAPPVPRVTRQDDDGERPTDIGEPSAKRAKLE